MTPIIVAVAVAVVIVVGVFLAMHDPLSPGRRGRTVPPSGGSDFALEPAGSGRTWGTQPAIRTRNRVGVRADSRTGDGAGIRDKGEAGNGPSWGPQNGFRRPQLTPAVGSFGSAAERTG